MLNFTTFLEKTSIPFLVLLFPLGSFLLYYSIVHDPGKIKEFLDTTGTLFIAIGSMYMGFRLGKRSK